MENSNSKSVKWVLDPVHSELEFKVKHLMITNVKGTFTQYTAEIGGEDFESSLVKVEVMAASINTNNEDRDKHLRSVDFFDVEKYPKLTFEGTSVKKVDDENYLVKGNLTIKNTTKEISLRVEYGGIEKDPWGNEKIGFSVSGSFNRKDWDLNWNAVLESGGVLVSDEVKVSADVQFIKQTISQNA
jgi:polyisoprenoid-binding protein YceI